MISMPNTYKKLSDLNAPNGDWTLLQIAVLISAWSILIRGNIHSVDQVDDHG